jgi:hypothetical protein
VKHPNAPLPGNLGRRQTQYMGLKSNHLPHQIPLIENRFSLLSSSVRLSAKRSFRDAFRPGTNPAITEAR